MGSDDHWGIGVEGRFGADVFNAVIPMCTKVVKPQRIFLIIDDIDQAGFEFDGLGWVDLALEDGVLHTLSIIEADFCGASESALAAFGAGGDIVSDEKVHV